MNTGGSFSNICHQLNNIIRLLAAAVVNQGVSDCAAQSSYISSRHAKLIYFLICFFAEEKSTRPKSQNPRSLAIRLFLKSKASKRLVVYGWISTGDIPIRIKL
jgi:hypothetical protein